ncbi:MAG: GspE/PulE family protein, partial [Phycisphaeraceae bacterium JB051]
ASDVHLQPYETSFVARMRIDGVLHDCFHLPKNVQEAIISRVKVMGKMNIAEKRLPQDGRASVQVGDREIDLRIASLPSNHGERVVIRLLDKSAQLYTLGEIGMNEQTIDRFRNLVNIEHGIILVTGPTGSGKTTTLYGTLDEINDNRRNIITLEDPIEYQLPGVSQTQINEKKGLTFASGLRNVLRQDPDIIMVGEIRDHETAVMAIQSALTGHLVFSTLHTNDASSAVTRLLDLGIEPYLVGSSVAGVMAQRLVRKVCSKCVSKIAATPAQVQSLQLTRGDVPEDIQLCQIAGCEHCRQTGYRGRVGLFELLQVNEAIRQDITQRATAARIKQTGIRHGMQTLRDDGVQKIINGITTLEEVDRVTVRLEGSENFVDETV